MPIFFDPKAKTWALKDSSQEELDFLIELGKEQFMANFASALFKHMMPTQEQVMLEATDKDQMGQA